MAVCQSAWIARNGCCLGSSPFWSSFASASWGYSRDRYQSGSPHREFRRPLDQVMRGPVPSPEQHSAPEPRARMLRAVAAHTRADLWRTAAHPSYQPVDKRRRDLAIATSIREPRLQRTKDSNMGPTGFVCYATTCGSDFVNGLLCHFKLIECVRHFYRCRISRNVVGKGSCRGSPSASHRPCRATTRS
jgi:hypothetical protein